MQGVAAGGALLPQLLPAATPEGGATAAQRRLPRLAVHVGQGEHRVGVGVLGDRRDQALRVELRFGGRRLQVAHCDEPSDRGPAEPGESPEGVSDGCAEPAVSGAVAAPTVPRAKILLHHGGRFPACTSP